MRECAKAAAAIRVCMEKNITPRKLLTKASFENALVMMMVLGGSTNAVLHLLAMAGTAGVPLTLDDFQRVSNKIPFLADLAPSGRYMAADLFDIGGMPSVMKLLVAAGLLDGSIPTVTGKTLAENIEPYPSLPQDQVLIRPLSNPIKPTGHIEILRGNLAPAGAVAKITGKEGLIFRGRAIVRTLHSSLLRHCPLTYNTGLQQRTRARRRSQRWPHTARRKRRRRSPLRRTQGRPRHARTTQSQCSHHGRQAH
jgi:dihydroxy-acid dehydratase